MDREQEDIQFLGFFGIFKESFSIITSWTNIFSQIALILVLPLAAVYLAHIEISALLFTDIMRDQYILDHTPDSSRLHHRVSNLLSSQLLTFFLFKIAYLLFFVVLALLSTSAVVYTVACIYTSRRITFRSVLSVVPQVWKRLLVTFTWNFVIVFAYNAVSLLLLFCGIVVLSPVPVLTAIFLIVFLIAYLAGSFYITLIWHLASVVSVLEDSYGLAAMMKSRELIKGKMGISFAAFLVIGICFMGTQLTFEFMVVMANRSSMGVRVVIGLVCLVAMSGVMLVGLVVQTMVYLVCKSYHHQNIDKSALSEHLGVYLGEYTPLKSKDVQLENFEV